MKVLLTGAGGFLGNHVLANLHQRGIDVVALGRRRPPGLENHDFIQHDLLTSDGIGEKVAAAGATRLLHLAWITEHGEYWTSPLNLRWVEATTRLLEAFCRAGGQQVVVAGTCAEYDWSHGYCREDSTPLAPATLYGIAKDASRRLAAAICAQHGIPFAWGRVFIPYGEGEDSRRLIPALIDVFAGRRAPFGVNATAFRDFLHASDAAEGLVTLMLSGASGAYNISSGAPAEIRCVVEQVARQMASDPQPVLALASERTGEPPLLVGENLKLKALGWQPRYTLAEGLRRTIAGLAESGRRKTRQHNHTE